MSEKELIGKYINGNYKVFILSDGTMIRSCKEDTMIPEFPDSMDIKITNKCDQNCSYCHEKSTLDGKHGKILNVPFFNSLYSYTQLAIGGGNVLEHPDFIPFLIWCKERHLIPSITLNQKHFMQNIETVKMLVDRKLVYGIGVSLVYPTDEFIETVKQFPNAVIHVIAGIVTETELSKLYDNNLKLLILGYKTFRKGDTYYREHQSRIDNNINWIKNNLEHIVNRFNVVSFDNLAIKQLQVRSIIPKYKWDQFYMGNDGTHTMYIDTVNEEYAVSSTSTERYKYTDETIEELFARVRRSVNEQES